MSILNMSIARTRRNRANMQVNALPIAAHKHYQDLAKAASTNQDVEVEVIPDKPERSVRVAALMLMQFWFQLAALCFGAIFGFMLAQKSQLFHVAGVIGLIACLLTSAWMNSRR